MKIAVLCTDLGIRLPGDKGASIHLMSVSRAFAEIGHEVLLVGVAGHGEAPTGLDTLLYPHPGRAEGVERERRKLAFVEHIVNSAGEPLSNFGPDLIYERLSLFGTAGHRLARRIGAAHVIEVNALLAREEARWRGLQKQGLAEQLERLVLGAADLRVAVSNEVRVDIERAAPGRPTTVVANGVDTSLFTRRVTRAEAEAAFGLEPGRPRVAFVGALRPWHGLDLLLRAVSLLGDVPEVVIAGDGPVRAELTTLAETLGLAHRLRWLGNVDHRDVPLVLGSADVAVAPYPPLEGFSFSPLKLFEYLASGTPVVASDIGQVRSILDDGRFGTLVTPGDVQALATAVCAALSKTPKVLEAAAAARHHTLASASWEQRAQQILDAVKEVDGRAVAG